MRGILKLVLVVLLVAASSCGTKQDPPDNPPSAQAPLQRACAWLWAQQQPDGAWRSETYGLMRSGQSLTPFVLHALLSVPEDVFSRPEGGVERALEFIREHTNDDGCLGRSDPMIADYPNHATAYAVRCLVAAGNRGDAELIRRMCNYLLEQQFNAGNDTDPASYQWGGWGFGSAGGVMDVAHTRRVLEALRDADALDDATSKRAQSYLRMLQRHPEEWRPQPAVPFEQDGEPGDSYDGGFYFSSTHVAMNKGGIQPAEEGRAAWFRSYATATCDGLLSLLAAGVPETDERVKAAAKWLDSHQGIKQPAGMPKDDPTPWYLALHYYNIAVRAEAWAAINKPGDWRTEITRHLKAQQSKDGSFTNEQSHLMKENDPLLATTLALIALTRL
jgi:hypothetical protein